MKCSFGLLFCLCSTFLFSQQLQLHYDVRHSLAPKYNSKNFATLYFEYFKSQDTGKAFIKPGSFLLKMQEDFTGDKNNIGKFYLQVSQSFRCWNPKFFLTLQYSGGGGITEPKQYSYYINNTFSAGIGYPFKWKNTYISSSLSYKYVPYKNPGNDFLCSLYWWKGLINYKLELSGDFSLWTDNKNHGDDLITNLHGKEFYFFAEPQCWYNLTKKFAVGTKENMYYHLYTSKNVLQVYPTLAVKCKL